MKSIAALSLKQLLIATILSGALAQPANASEEFFVPFPEDDTLDFLTGISSDSACGPGNSFAAPDPGEPINTVTDFVVRIPGTVIVIDHAEDGYEPDIEGISNGSVAPTNASTRVYGDGDISNGAAPGITTNAGDFFASAGQVVVFEESINTATQLGDIEITGAPITGGGTRTQDGVDGGDRIFSTETINVTRAQWAGSSPAQSGTLFAGAFELFPLSQWGDSFTVPVGEDTGVVEFQWTGITIMAANDNTSVSVDANADGDFTDPGDVNAQIINRGETIEVLGRNDTGGQTTGGLNQGARIFSSDIIQTNIISGQECSNYASRWFTLFPDALLGSTYYEPVATPVGDDTQIYLYNPSPNPLTINWETSAATGGLQTPIVVPAGGVIAQVIPADSGARFFTGSNATFGALTVTDIGQTAHDWGHASTSQRLMGSVIQVGFAEGDDPSQDTDFANGGENAAPVWLIADNPTDPSDSEFEICVDVSGDGGANTDPNTGRTFDYQFTLDRLDSARLYDGGRDTPNNVPAHIDGDQSGMLAFVCDGSDAILAAAWGQDPTTASAGVPAVDVGTTVRSISDGVAFIGDTIYEDENNNGVRDPGERGIENVTVVLTPPPSVNLGFGPGQPVTTSTDFNGTYLFTNLVNGDYNIEVIAPTGFVQTADPDAANGDPVIFDNLANPTIADSSGRLDQDFGYSNTVPGGQVGDFIYADTNGNGIQEPGELGIPGIDVELCTDPLFAASDNFNAASYNNNAALWSGPWIELGDDAAGAPNNAVAGPFGNFDGFRLDITNPQALNRLFIRGNATTAAGPSLTRQFNATGLGIINGSVDASAFIDGVFEAADQLFIQVSINGAAFTTVETINGVDITTTPSNQTFSFNSAGAGNVRLRLQVNGSNISGGEIEAFLLDNLLLTPEPVCQVLTTDASGGYLFTGLADGPYTVTVLNPPAGTSNTDDPGGDGDSTNQFSLFSSGGNLEQDFGYFTPATVIGHLYLDSNGNGIQDLGEPNLANVDVLITDSNGNLQTVTSDANGDYSASVPPGVTQVNIDESDPQYPAGFIQTDGIDPSTVVAVAGDTVDAGDDGYFQGNVIGDTVYSEEDGTPGIQGAGDPGIPNVLVTLTPEAGVDLGAGPGVAITTTTDANGNYSFVGLPDGDYVVTIDQPSGSNQTQDPDGGNDNSALLSISGGVVNNNQDFGYDNTVPDGQIGDLIYNDTNGNGVQDSGELGIAGISVQLCGDLDDNNATPNTCRVEITDANGFYLFGDNIVTDTASGAPADNPVPISDAGELYTVTVLNPPVGQINSEDPDNGLPNFSQLALTSSGGNLDQDFGYFESATVTGHLYIDSNGDGIQQAGEPDLVNVDVVITDANGNQQTVSTDINGDYSVQVPPGATTADVDETDPQYPSSSIQTEGTDPTTVTAVAGSSVSAGVDGYAPAGSIGDFIFFDSNTAGTVGVFDAGIDDGAPGVTVTLTPPAGVDLGGGAGVAISTVTDANGNYSFGSLPAGQYTVAVTPPNGTSATVDPNEPGQCVACDNSSTITISAGEENTAQDFGYQTLLPLGQIGDRIFDDLNGNGVFDTGETGIAGIVVQLCGDLDDNDSTPDTCRTETTDADGDYLFGDGLASDTGAADPADTGVPGTTGTEDYTVTVLNPPVGSINTADPDGLSPNVSQLTLPSGFSNVDQDFGYSVLASLAGSVWLDEDLDGISDVEEAGITDTQVQLILDGVVVATTVTDANGNYAFSNIVPGDYVVNVVDSSLPNALSNTAGPNGVDNRPVTVASGEGVRGIQFGYIPNETDEGVIGDRVWGDADADGIQDPSEAGIEGVFISLTDVDGNPILNDSGVAITATTNSNGDYLLSEVPFGEDYIVVISASDPSLSGFIPTAGPQSEGALVSRPIALTPAEPIITDVDFGFDSASIDNTISDTLWLDDNANGIFDSGEEPLSGVSVNLYSDVNGDGVPDDADGNGQPDVVATVISDENGDVTFSGLANGSYVLGVTDVDLELMGLSSTTPQAASTFANTVTVTGGSSDSQNSFGYISVGLISGTIYNDLSDPTPNGNREPNEAGIAGVLVTLTPPAGVDLGNGPGVAITTLTDTGGRYEFAGVPPGNYTIDVASPGGDPIEDPDATADNATNVTLLAGESSSGNDFGYANAPDVFVASGTVFLDPDTDGVEDAQEPGIEGVTVALVVVEGGEEIIIATAVTDANGDYSFSGLTDGDYSVLVTDQNGRLGGHDITSGLESLALVIDGSDENDINFGYIDQESTGSIAGELWIDEDGDGIADADETNLSGVSVYLCNSPVVNPSCDPSDPGFVAQTTTDANGEYVFNNLPAGQYVIGQEAGDLPPGLTQTVAPALVALSEGENVADVDVGFEPAAGSGVLSGVVWTDVNSNGIFDAGEAPIPGVTVVVNDFANASGGNVGPVVGTALTGPDGRWILSNITGAGLTDGLKVSYTQSDIPADLVSTQPSNFPLGDTEYLPVDLATDPDNNISSLNFGFPPEVATVLGSISGTLYSDVDQSMSYVPSIDGELAGVTLNLINSAGEVVASVVTDENGDYSFTGLPSDVYSVIISDTQNVLQDLNSLEVIANPISINTASANPADYTATGQDAGFVSSATLFSIGDRFFFDTNDNGIADEGEPGIEGVTVQCWLDADNSETPNDPTIASASVVPQPGIDNLVRTTTTDENGEYSCTSLPAGQYIVTVVDALGFDETADGASITNSIADNAAKPWNYTVTLSDSSPNTTADFGVRGTNSLSGTIVIEDEDLVEPVIADGDNVVLPTELDGRPDGVSPDSPATNVTVALLVEQNGEFVELLSTTTDASGNYSFTNLPDGNYRVVVRPNGSSIDGFGQTGDPDLVANLNGNGTEDLVCDSPTDVLCDDESPTYNLVGGASQSDVSFAYQRDFTTTPVTMNYFRAADAGGVVEFVWETANEVAHAGFQLYERDGEGWKLISDLIVGEPGSSLDIRTYRYQVASDAQWFALVSVSTQEEVVAHGPFRLNQEYGQTMIKPVEFDWSQYRPEKPANQSVAESVNRRLQRALQADPSLATPAVENSSLEQE